MQIPICKNYHVKWSESEEVKKYFIEVEIFYHQMQNKFDGRLYVRKSPIITRICYLNVLKKPYAIE